MSNAHYWTDKENRAEVAKKHVIFIQNNFSDSIKNSVNNTIIYGINGRTPNPKLADNIKQTIKVVPDGSVSGAFKYGIGKTCILNFASYKFPGGAYTEGSRAQEECLCMESTLYNVLSRFAEFYDWNKQHLNKGLYLDRALYSKDILFEHNGIKREFDVLTCAAPNYSTASRYNSCSKEENDNILKTRIDFIIDILIEQNIDTCILGAYGCGVFGQNATDVANYFKESIKRLNANIVFAVLENPYDNNYAQFIKVFNN